jgi:hypothetical protein
MSTRRAGRPARRDQRGLVFPSPVMILSIVAVAMAGVAWFATRPHDSAAAVVAPSAQQSPSSNPSAHHQPKSHHPRLKPAVDRSQVLVDVFNNSQVSGLAGRVASRVSELGWQVVGSDNWYGTIPDSTVYYPPRLAKAGHQLALDLGIRRTMPSVTPMRFDRLTVILTGPLASTG